MLWSRWYCNVHGSSLWVQVHGVELSPNQINIARQRLAACQPVVQQRVQFDTADATTVQLKKNYYDVVYSKNSIVVIPDKEKVYKNIMNCIREDGRLFISDFFNGDVNIDVPGYNTCYKLNFTKLISISNNIHIIEAAGFKNVKAEDLTENMIGYLENSLREFKATKQAFIQDFDIDSYQTMEHDFSKTVAMMKDGAIRWVLFTAIAPKIKQML